MTSFRTALSGGSFVVAVAAMSTTPACSGTSGGDLFGPDPGGNLGVPGTSGTSGTSGGTSGTSGGTSGTSGTSGEPCTGLECQKVDCGGGAKTSLTGKVYDPAGTNTIYDAVVFVPKGALPPLSSGASCDACGPIDAIVEARTDNKGEFVLDDIPVVKDLPVVVQIGKWRRQIKVDASKKCAENKVGDRTLRLPKNGSEGDMPHIAVTAGGCDALECLLRGMGVDQAEFVPGASTAGHVHVFNGDGGQFPAGPPAGGTSADKLGGQLWNDAAKMMKYDSVLLSCECSEMNENKGGDVGTPGARQSLFDYANAGGRVVATHFHYTWMKNSPQTAWKDLANWTPGAVTGSGLFDVDLSTPAGNDFAAWLLANNASTTLGSIQITDATSSISQSFPPAQPWIKKGSATTFFTAPTPTTGAACGRLAFSDVHVMGISGGGQAFPAGCPAPGVLTPQQKALEFQIFQMSACGK